MVKQKHCLMAAVAALALFAGGRMLAEDKHDHKGEKGPHGGAILEIGDKEDTHAEIVHDQKAGKLTLYILSNDQKTPVRIKDSPKLNLKAKDGNKQLELKAVDAKDGAASHYEATDDALKAEPLAGRISITLADGKKYNVKLEEEGKKEK